MKDYKIIQYQDLIDLHEDINKRLLDGYILVGGICIHQIPLFNDRPVHPSGSVFSQTWYAQAVAKPI